MSKFKIKGLTFTTLGQTIRFINQLREIGDQLKGFIFGVPMGVNLGQIISVILVYRKLLTSRMEVADFDLAMSMSVHQDLK